MSIRSFAALGWAPNGRVSVYHLSNRSILVIGTRTDRSPPPHLDRSRRHTSPRPSRPDSQRSHHRSIRLANRCHRRSPADCSPGNWPLPATVLALWLLQMINRVQTSHTHCISSTHQILPAVISQLSTFCLKSQICRITSNSSPTEHLNSNTSPSKHR